MNYMNPCIDPAFVNIVPATMPDQTFPIYGNEISWTHDAFVVDYNPTPHALCGTLEKTVKFDTEGVNTDVTDSTAPLSYENNGDVRTFKL